MSYHPPPVINKEKKRASKISLVNQRPGRTVDNKEISSGIIRPENSSFRIYNRAYHHLPKGHTYIGRGSVWGNPFVIGRDGTREEVIQKYTNYFVSNLPLVFEAFDLRCGAGAYSLQSMNRLHLVCYCAPNRCHGEVIAKVADLILAYCREECREEPPVEPTYALELQEQIDTLFTKGIWDIIIKRCLHVYREGFLGRNIHVIG